MLSFGIWVMGKFWAVFFATQIWHPWCLGKESAYQNWTNCQFSQHCTDLADVYFIWSIHMMFFRRLRRGAKARRWNWRLLMLKRGRRKCNLKYFVVISSLWYEDITVWRKRHFFYMTTQQPTDGHSRVPTQRTADTDLALLHDLSDLPGHLMKPLCPQKVSSITSTPAYKYLSHQWQKDLLTVIMSFVSQIEEVCARVRER